MDITLVVNPGSSSKKYELYRGKERLFSVHYEVTARGYNRTITARGGQPSCIEVPETVYQDALQDTLSSLISAGVLLRTEDIQRAGVRTVAPGTYFHDHHEIDEYLIQQLKKLTGVLPLHVPPVLSEIETLTALLPHVTLVSVSDSAFHKTLPKHQYQYSLSGALDYGIRRFGYHGLSVQSVLHTLSDLEGSLPKRVIVAHIGSGVSVTGALCGKSTFTTMGYTPASGLMMSSRCGDIDPGALIAFLHRNNLRGSVAHTYIQKHGGFAGLLDTSDLRVVLARESQGDEDATDAMRTFLFDIQKAILGAAVVLNGIDVLVLTATAMERNDELRARLIGGLSLVHAKLDEQLNEAESKSPRTISSAESAFPIYVIPTDEMGEIARITSAMNSTSNIQFPNL